MFNSDLAEHWERRSRLPEARQDPELARSDSGCTQGHHACTPSRSLPQTPGPSPEGGRRRILWACPHTGCAKEK